MGKYVINGGKKLSGEVYISGAKNSVLPILAGTVLNSGITVLKNVPMLSDTFVSIEILKSLGCRVEIGKNRLLIDSSNINNTDVPENLVKKMRSSIVFLGSLLARFKKGNISYPGGCNLGKRPIDFHLNGFKNININIFEDGSVIEAFTDKIIGNEICLPFASVGATQNIILASIFCEGQTIIKNSAKEPEILDMQNFLNEMGANVSGAGTDTIKIKGVKNLKKYVEYSIMPDRIEAGTFLCLGAYNHGEILINNIFSKHLESLTNTLEKMNCELDIKESSIKIKGNKVLKPIEFLETAPYPLFPTDLQPQLMTVLCFAKGNSVIRENIFEARNMHISELNKMGANIQEIDNTFIIKGVEKLNGTEVFSKDLRGGASLVMAGIFSEGTTTVFGTEYIERGYENLEQKLKGLGADIKYIKD